MLTRQICPLMRNACFPTQGVILHADVSYLQRLAEEVFGFETALGQQAKLLRTILTVVQKTKDRKSEKIRRFLSETYKMRKCFTGRSVCIRSRLVVIRC